MNVEREEMAQQNESLLSELNQLKSDRKSASEQFTSCQLELEKALQLASEFRQKIDEDEKIKQDLLNQLLSERANKAKEIVLEQGRAQQAIAEANNLKSEMEKMRNQAQDSVTRCQEAVKAKQDYEQTMANERQSFQQKIVSNLSN